MASADKKKSKSSNNNVTKATKKVSPWAERIGVYTISLLTLLGVGLITYTGMRALIHDDAPELPELLNHEQIVQNSNLTDNEDEVTDTEEDSSDDDTEEEEQEEQEPTEESELTSFIGLIIENGVNVREAPEANDSVDILTQLNEGDRIQVLNSDYNEDWMEVEYENRTGYVYKEFIEQAD